MRVRLDGAEVSVDSGDSCTGWGGWRWERRKYWDLRELREAEPGSLSCLFLMVSIVPEPNPSGIPAVSLSSYTAWDR